MDLLREGASKDGEPAVSERTAQWVWDFVSAGYGPGGGHKLVDGELARAATALRAVPGEPAVRPYQRLAEAPGAQALAVLIAAGLVRRLDGRLPRYLEGIRLARRQALAWCGSQARDASPEEALRDGGLPTQLLTELASIVVDGRAHLDRIAVHAADVEAPAWSMGIPIQAEGPDGAVRVLVVDSIPDKPRTDASLRLQKIGEFEDSAEGHRRRIRALGATLLVCRKAIPDDLRSRLHFDGIATCPNAERGLVERIRLATAATATATPETATQADLGTGTLRRRVRRRDHVLSGDGPTATLEVPGIGPGAELAKDEAEHWLRAVGEVWQDARVLPGGGAWQRALAAHLRDTAAHAGTDAQGIEAAARVFDDIAVALLHNLGLDATRQRHVDGVTDAYALVRPALVTGFDTALRILRIDARYTKRSSHPGDLRGNLGPSGSPKGMPGDIPPLM